MIKLSINKNCNKFEALTNAFSFFINELRLSSTPIRCTAVWQYFSEKM